LDRASSVFYPKKKPVTFLDIIQQIEQRARASSGAATEEEGREEKGVATDYRSKGREVRRVEEGERGATKEEAIAAGRQTPTSLLTSLRLALYLDLEDRKVGHARDRRGGRRKTAPPRGSRPTPQTFRSSHLRPSRTASTTSDRRHRWTGRVPRRHCRI
jgi:hypothetical protein